MESKGGCSVSRGSAGIFMYTDEINLLAPCVYIYVFIKLLEIRLNYATKFDFNLMIGFSNPSM